MSPAFQKLAAVATIAWLGLSPAVSAAGQTAKVLPDFTVFVDPPTGFVFVKLPAGWKFVGQAELPTAGMPAPGVVTSLLDGSDDDTTERQAQAANPR